MKILIFSQCFYPERFLINDIVKQLVSVGNEVTVVTGQPNYPGGEIFPEYKGKHVKEEVIFGARIIRAEIIPRGHNRAGQFLNYLSYAKNAYKSAKNLSGFDVVYCYQLTPVLQLKPAVKYAKKHNLKLVCYCLDLAPLSGSELMHKFKIFNAYYKRQAKKLYNACDKIAVTSKSFIKYLNAVNGVPFERLVYLPQHAPENLINAKFKAECDKPVTFVYAGNVGKSTGLKTLVFAVNELKKQGVSGFKVEIVGDGNLKQNLLALTSELELCDLIEFYGGVPMSEMVGVYNRASALIITLIKGQITVPGKLQAYMATGKPVLGAMSGSGKELIEEADCGKCADAEDYLGLARLMKDFIDNPQPYTRQGLNGKAYAKKHFTLSEHVFRLEIIIDATVTD